MVDVSATETDAAQERKAGDCEICFNFIKEEVRMCPICSANFCKECIIDRYRGNTCPKCREYVYVDEYVRNRGLELMNQQAKLTKNARCKLHNVDRIYFCVTCKVVMCPECLLDGHTAHERKILTDEYQKRKQEIIDASEPIKEVHAKLKSTENQIIDKIKKIEKNGNQYSRNILNYTELLRRSINVGVKR